jgi:hypothetical protein
MCLAVVQIGVYSNTSSKRLMLYSRQKAVPKDGHAISNNAKNAQCEADDDIDKRFIKYPSTNRNAIQPRFPSSYQTSFKLGLGVNP